MRLARPTVTPHAQFRTKARSWGQIPKVSDPLARRGQTPPTLTPSTLTPLTLTPLTLTPAGSFNRAGHSTRHAPTSVPHHSHVRPRPDSVDEHLDQQRDIQRDPPLRSEERRVGKEC